MSRYRDLQTEAGRSATGTFVVEGGFCVSKLAQSRLSIRSVVVQQGRHEDVLCQLPDDVSVFEVSASDIRELVGYDFHRGILAEGVRPPAALLKDVSFDAADPPLALAVFGVSLTENLGSMIRSATALGVHRLVIGPRTADPFSRRSIRVSMGTVFEQSVFYVNDTFAELTALATDHNIRVVATTLGPGAIALDQFRRDDRPILLVMGSEPDGVGRDVEAAATDRITIPMKLNTDSLNVSVAAAVFMYGLTK
ncbi:TrmH family RNA methyltransferase [Rubripirellula tenax]|uniref:TrmH family RNA methyltransferase n=1 Tax=Rubripirellula tenax TaxID=2528015 RepID=UPI00164671D5|nr:RNA methyltransferase [Rubripirellula tenax]